MKNITKFTVCLFLVAWCAGLAAPQSSVNIPGTVERFRDFFQYPSLDPDNFVFYINEILLWEQLPEYRDARIEILLKAGSNMKKRERLLKLARKNHGFILNRTSSYKIRAIFSAHAILERKLYHRNPGNISLDLGNREQFKEAEALLLKMGLILEKGDKPRFRLVEHYDFPHFDVNWYYRIGSANLLDLEKQVNRTGRFDFQLKVTPVPLPRDLEFFRDVTGLDLTPETFMETLTRDKRLQLLTGILYRLPGNEIAYLDNLLAGNNQNGKYEAWKQIYQDDDFLTGFFLLCHAFRVKDNALVMRGGEKEKKFWEAMAGITPGASRLEFLRRLATTGSGKLNYFYIFSYFLPEPTRRAVLCDFDPQRFGKIYHALSLERNEKINRLNVPQLKDFNVFQLFYALRTKQNGKISFPGGLDTWLEAVGAGNQEKTFASLIAHLLGEKNKKKSLERFTALYCKFHDREELLTRDVLKTLYNDYGKYNVLIDFVEKIPLKKPGSILKLINWVKAFESARMPKKQKQALRGLVQSLLELAALRAGYSEQKYDYDTLIEKIASIPPSGALAVDRCFDFLQRHLGLDFDSSNVDRAFRRFLFPSVSGPKGRMKIHGQTYRLEAAEMLRREFSAIMESQQVCDFSVLVSIRKDLAALERGEPLGTKRRTRLLNNFASLPTRKIKNYYHPNLVDLVRPYRDGWLSEKLEHLLNDASISKVRKKETAAQKEKRLNRVKALIREIKAGCLLHEFKHYMVTAVYAAALKHAGPRVLLNPDLTRLHDFSVHGSLTPWNHTGYADKTAGTDAYHIRGGLSRLPVTLSAPLAEYLFHRDDTQYFRQQGRAILYNNLDLFPYPGVDAGQEPAAKLIDSGKEFLTKAKQNPKLKEKLISKLSIITSGYRYRRLINALENNHPVELYYHELAKLGEAAVQDKSRLNRLGGVYANTFGTLKPHYFHMFPRQLSQFFAGRWIGMEMNTELKLKAAYFSYKDQKPPQILGALLYRFLFQESMRLRQWYQNDFYHVDDLYKIYDNRYLEKLYDNLRKTGILKIK